MKLIITLLFFVLGALATNEVTSEPYYDGGALSVSELADHSLKIEVTKAPTAVRLVQMQICHEKKQLYKYYISDVCQGFMDFEFRTEGEDFFLKGESIAKQTCLPFGPGTYTVLVFISADGKMGKYKQVEIKIQQTDPNCKRSEKTQFRQQNQLVSMAPAEAERIRALANNEYINRDDESIQTLAKNLTNGLKTDAEKSRAIYRWVTTNVRYDTSIYNITGNDQVGYSVQIATIPPPKKAKDVLVDKIAVCFGYAALNASLHRALGIPAKFIAGDLNLEMMSGPHGWNEVLLDGQWYNMDPTLDAGTGIIENGLMLFKQNPQLQYYKMNTNEFNRTHKKYQDGRGSF